MKAVDISGKRFGRLVAIEPTKENNVLKWRCKCDCGNEKNIRTGHLINGYITSCGCLKSEINQDLTGFRFGRLSVLCKYHRAKNGSMLYKCICDCGNEVIARSDHLKGKHVVSCGCYLSDKNRDSLISGKSYEMLKKEGWHDGTNEAMLTNKPTKSNKTGVRGVTFDMEKCKYRAKITYKGKEYHIGYFFTLKDAKEARKIAEKKIWGKDLE